MNSDLSNRIKAIRVAANDTPAKAAEKVGVSRQAFTKWENGNTENMKLSNLLRFCDKYNTDIECLLRGIEAKSDDDVVAGDDEYPKHEASVLDFQQPNPGKHELLALIESMDERQCYIAIGAIRAAVPSQPNADSNFAERAGQ